MNGINIITNFLDYITPAVYKTHCSFLTTLICQHFVGQIAIERGIDNYPIAVQKLIADFLNDSYVLESLKLDRK